MTLSDDSTAYLDHAASTPIRPVVAELVRETSFTCGNAASPHFAGRAARSILEQAREQLAAALGAHPSEVVFTSGGTESDNLAVIGGYRARREGDARRTRLVVGALDHAAVIESAQHLAQADGATLTWLRPGRDGVVRPETLEAAIADGGPETVALVSCIWVNNEIGTVAPIPALAAVAAAYGVPLHTDAVQAIGQIPVDFGASGATMASLSGHKIGGPLGAGALLVRRDAQVRPTTYGGGQERRLRSGTVAVPLAAGLAAAVDAAVAEQAATAVRLTALRDRLIAGARRLVPGLTVTGAWREGDITERSPANVHLLLPHGDADALIYLFDAAGIAVSAGSACHAGVTEPSHVVLALGYSEEEAAGAVRVTLGRTSTPADVDAFLHALPQVVARLGAAAGVDAR